MSADAFLPVHACARLRLRAVAQSFAACRNLAGLGSVLLLFATGANAQPVFGPVSPPAESNTTSAAPSFAPAAMPASGSALASVGSFSSSGDPAPFRWGPVEMRPHFNYRLTYGNGIQSRPGNQEDIAVHNLVAGMAFGLGDAWRADYTATQTIYAQGNFQNTLGHSANLQGGGKAGTWMWSVSQGYSLSSSPMIETARQTEQKTISTNLGAMSALSSKLSLALGLSQSLRFSDSIYADALQWSTMDWLRYQVSADISTGIGAGVGYIDLSDIPNQSFQRLQVQLAWKFTPKTALNVEAGFEVRDSRAANAPSSTNPIFSFSLSNQPFSQTRLSINASREMGNSLYQNQVSTTTQWGADLQQRLLGKLNFRTGVRFQKADYSLSGRSGDATRGDKRRSFNMSLGTAFRRRGSIAISYARSTNSTNLAGYGFKSNQVGLDIGWRY